MATSSAAMISGVVGAVAYVLSLLVDEEWQSVIFFVLTASAVVLAISWVAPTAKDQAGHIDVFHPSILVIAFFFVYFIGSAAILVLLKDYRSDLVVLSPDTRKTVNAAMALGILSVASFGLGARLSPFRIDIDALQNRQLNGSVPVFILAAAFLTVGLVTRLYQLSMFGPVSTDMLQYLSPGRRRELEIAVPQSLVILGSMADWGALMLLVAMWTRTRRASVMGPEVVMAVMVVIAMAILSFVISAKRSGVVLLALLPVIWAHYLNRRVSVPRMVVLSAGALGIIAVALVARVAVPLIVRGLDPTEYLGGTLSEVLWFYFETAEFATFDVIAGTLLYRDQLLASIGDDAVASFLRMTFATFTVFVPSAIWEGKPIYTDTGHYYFRYFTGSDADVGLAVTSWGTAYLYFGVIGVIVGFVLLGWILKSGFIAFSPSRGAIGTVVLYSQFYWMLFQFLRFGTIGFTFLYFIQAVMVGAIGVFMVTHAARRR